MQGKLALAAGFVGGYVLGSKAGRQRYEEIVAQARKVAGNQTVQSTAGVLQAQASDLVSKAKQSELVNKAVDKVRGGEDKSSTPSVYSTSSTTPSSAYASESASYGSESGSYSTPATGSADLFEPSGSADPSSPVDPLNPTNPSSTNGSNP